MDAQEFVTRREFDLLYQRIENIDQNGTRGVLVVQERIADVAKDVARLEMAFEQHEKRHIDERKEARSARRWAMTTAITALATLATVVGTLFTVGIHH